MTSHVYTNKLYNTVLYIKVQITGQLRPFFCEYTTAPALFYSYFVIINISLYVNIFYSYFVIITISIYKYLLIAFFVHDPPDAGVTMVQGIVITAAVGALAILLICCGGYCLASKRRSQVQSVVHFLPQYHVL